MLELVLNPDYWFSHTMANFLYVSCCRDAYPMLLVANKIDLVRQRRVSEEQGRQLAASLKV